jgi:ABC-type dipeptide/oligopeptide/nickel transport system permease component
MTGYVVQRALIALALIWFIMTLVFFLVHSLPGDAILAMGGDRPETMSEEQRAFMRHELGLDRPLYLQYVDWISKAVQGDFGTSVSSKRPVFRDVMVCIPRTVELAVGALIIGFPLGISAGVITALRRNSRMDVIVNGGFVVLGSLPVYITGLVLLLVFGLYLGWVPTGGFVAFGENVRTHLRLLILPSLTLGLWLGAVAARMTRHAMLEVLSQDYIRTAFSKGLARRTVYYSHALKNALIPVVTATGLQIGSLLGGAVLTETVYTWPGLGSTFVAAVLRRDYPTIQGVVVITVTAFVFTNLAVDLIVGCLDPRISRD